MRRIAPSLLLFAGVLAVYLANGRAIGAGDTLPARYLPWSLVQQQSLDLDRFASLHDERARQTFPLLDGLPYYLRHQNGHYRSAYTPGPAVLATPVYALPILLGAQPDGAWPGALEKLSAGIITALSAVLLYRALRGLVSPGWALAITLIYAFGTSSLSVSGQALWQHGPSQLFVSLLLYCLVKGLRDERYLARAGFAMSAATVMRSTDALLVLPVAAWIAYTHRRLIVRLILWALPPIVWLGLYGVLTQGPLTGPTGPTTVPFWALFVQISLREGLPGLLLSPARGLFVYSPVLLFSILGAVAVWRGGPPVFKALSLGVPLVIVVVSKWFTWWGGHSWGPRLLADIAPVLCFFLYPLTGWLSRRPLARALFVVLAAASVLSHGIGAFLYDGRWETTADIARDPARLWSWKDGPVAFYGGEILSRVRRAVVPDGSARATSASAPDELRASYAGVAIPKAVVAGEPIVLPMTVTNTGRAVWLAAAPGDRGAVRLGWKWYRGRSRGAGGRDYPRSDVAPGERWAFTARIPAPAAPGQYTLVLDLVSELVTWFEPRGSAPIRAVVEVAPVDVAHLLSAPIAPAEPTPSVDIETRYPVHHVGDSLDLTVTLRYPHRPRTYDAYLVLEGPAPGVARIFNGERLTDAAGASWPAWVKNLPVPAHATGRFTVPLTGLPPGSYRWSVVLTEPGMRQAVARASTAFRIES